MLSSVGSNVNLGLMEFVTGGNANDTGGFIRFAVQPEPEAQPEDELEVPAILRRNRRFLH